MGILNSLSKSLSQVTQIKTLNIALLAQNSHTAGCMVCVNISVTISTYICCFPVSIPWAYLHLFLAGAPCGPWACPASSFPSIRCESFTLGFRIFGFCIRAVRCSSVSVCSSSHKNILRHPLGFD